MKNLFLLSILFLLISCSKESDAIINKNEIPLESRSHEIVPSIEFNGSTLYVHPTLISVSGHGNNFKWGKFGTATGATSKTDDETNTQLIVQSLGNFNNGLYAARVCADLVSYGHDDWYLPSKNEIKAVFDEKDELGITLFHSWTSSEQNKNVAWTIGNAQEETEIIFETVWPKEFKNNLPFESWDYPCRCVRRD